MKQKLGKYIREYSVRDKGKGYPVYSVTNSKGFCQEYFGKNVASENTSNYKVVPKGCFAYNPSRINVGSVACQDKEDFVSVSPIYVIFEVSQEISQDYLMYYLKSNYCMTYIKAYARGAVRNNLKLSQLGEFDIPVPPIAEQQRIVAELDLISSIIDKQKAQLEEYDQLAQSIFYDMFGELITNEKGWKKEQLKTICSKITDGTHDTPERLNNGVKFITGKHIRPFFIDYENSDYVTEEVHKEIYLRCNPELGDVLYTNIGAGIGNAALNTVEYEFSMKNVALLKPQNNIVNGYYIEYYLNNEDIKSSIIDIFSNGGAQRFLSLKSIAKIPILVPPLSLQQQFAEKVEAIEKQKALVQASIAETETLFNSRMDYYFN